MTHIFNTSKNENHTSWELFYLAGSSKMVPSSLIFSIAMGADNSFYVKSIATDAPTFFGYVYYFSLSHSGQLYLLWNLI